MDSYKALIIIPIILLLFSVGVLVNGYLQTGEWFQRSIELKGGSMIELQLSERIDVISIESSLSDKFPLSMRELSGLGGYGIVIEVGPETDPQQVLSELDAFGIDTSQPSIQTIGPSLGESFWGQAQIAVILAFIFMGGIVFFLFRKIVPSLAVMSCAVADILVTLAFMQLFGIDLSLAGFASILMLIGYSIDTDILLTTRIMKGMGEMKDRHKSALFTGLTMSVTTLGALSSLLIFGLSPIISQIATVLIIGLSVDVLFTWLQNSVLIRWYCERRGI
ncbi:MAG: protein translocase subunit SecF [Candidatus Aenigmarchaeota archaeon]